MDKPVLESSIASITIGTAGHIDHGKTALVERLTGIDPDRLKEERIRGMTIDLGYAFYVTRKGKKVGIIDVPGHERLVRNMVTGAASIDLVVLAVAADDGVMPQTREHLDIMEVLGIRKGLVALTKIDLVDGEMAELAREDVEILLCGTFLEGCPIVPLSSVTGEGMERFIEILEEEIEKVDHPSPSGLFRLPVQRVFTAKGFGTVVTGVPISGSIRAGDPVEVLPKGLKGKVRGLQAFGQPCVEGRAGHRIAVNISDVDYNALHRGCTVATPGCFEPCLFFEAHFTLFDDIAFSIKDGAEVKVHAGTAEEMGKIVLLDARSLKPGQDGYIQMRLEQPMIVAPGDRFLIRRHSPPLSIGGGMILKRSSGKAKRFKANTLDPLKGRLESLQEGIGSLMAFEMKAWQEGFFTARDIAMALGQQTGLVEERLAELLSSGEVLEVVRGTCLHRDRYGALAEAVEEALSELHRAAPLSAYLDIKALRNRLRWESGALQALLKTMEKEGRIETTKGGGIRRAGYRVELTGEQRRLAEGLLKTIAGAGLSPPETAELASSLGVAQARVEEIAGYLISRGELMQVGGFYFSPDVIRKLKECVVECGEAHGEVKIPLIRDTFSTTRKYLIPLMEHLDDIGLTRREGDRRFLKEKPGA